MFTGLVEELGKIISIDTTHQGANIKIACSKVIACANIGDSIATNGVCLTVTKISSNSFSANIMNESLNVSTLKQLQIGDLVNLEKSVTLQSFLGGHLVTGDVDCLSLIHISEKTSPLNISDAGFC